MMNGLRWVGGGVGGRRVVYPLYMADLLMKRSHTMEYFTTRREEREHSTPHTEREREGGITQHSAG